MPGNAPGTWVRTCAGRPSARNRRAGTAPVAGAAGVMASSITCKCTAYRSTGR